MLSTLSCVFVMLRLFHIKVDMETGELKQLPLLRLPLSLRLSLRPRSNVFLFIRCLFSILLFPRRASQREEERFVSRR